MVYLRHDLDLRLVQLLHGLVVLPEGSDGDGVAVVLGRGLEDLPECPCANLLLHLILVEDHRRETGQAESGKKRKTIFGVISSGR